MREFQGKRQIKRILYSRGFGLVLFVIVVLMAHRVWLIWQRSQVVKAGRDEMAAQVAALAAREAVLKSDLAALDSERGREAVIRQKFAVIKEGEGVVTVVTPPSATTSLASTSRTWWQKLLHLDN